MIRIDSRENERKKKLEMTSIDKAFNEFFCKKSIEMESKLKCS